MREDTLSLFLNQAAILEGSKILVVENCKGLVLGAVTKRLNN